MKIIIDNQSRLDDKSAFDIAISIYRRKKEFIHKSETGYRVESGYFKITTSIWIDTEGLNFRINDMKGDGK